MDKTRRIDFGEISIEYKLMNKGINMNAFHSHNSYEIMFMVNGSKIILLNDSYQELQAGDIILFSPNEPHKSLGNNSYEWICLNFSDEYLKKYFTPDVAKVLVSAFETRTVHPSASQFTELCRMFYKLYNNYNNEDDMLFMDITNLLMYISKINRPILKKVLSTKNFQI
ncbi:MAG: AraC family ligand binding domain-containing protein [Candidatus Ornithomonoglobus sp.]